MASRDFRRPGRGSDQYGVMHRWVCSRRGDPMSNVPSGQVAAFRALTLEIQCFLVGLRSKTLLYTYEILSIE